MYLTHTNFHIKRNNKSRNGRITPLKTEQLPEYCNLNRDLFNIVSYNLVEIKPDSTKEAKMEKAIFKNNTCKNMMPKVYKKLAHKTPIKGVNKID